MQENVSVIIATIVAVIIIVLFPIYNIALRQDSISNNMVVKATTTFVDEVRNKGYIDKATYEKYLNELGKTGNTYDVEMEVHSPILLEVTNEENVYEEKYEIEYTNKILEDMSNSELFKDEDSVVKSNAKYLNSDDKFYVRVKNTNITQAQVLLDRLLGGKQDERIVVNYGGIVYSNEWEYGENAEMTNTNISLSRPLNKDLKEYKYEYIADVYDQYTDTTETIYGIAVRLYVENGENKIRFILKYKDIYEIKNSEGKYDKSSTEKYIGDYVEVEGISVNRDGIEVEQIKKERKSEELYDYEFLITLSNIEYSINSYYEKSRLKIKSGAAFTASGVLSEINSKEFIVFYEAEGIEIEAIPKYYGTSGADYARIEVKLNKVDDNIEDIRYVEGEHMVYEFSDTSLGESMKNMYDSTTNRYITPDDIEKRIHNTGTYTIYVKDVFGREKTCVVIVNLNIEIKAEVKYYDTAGVEMSSWFGFSARIEVKLNKANYYIEDVRYAEGEHIASDFNSVTFGTSIKSSYDSDTGIYKTGNIYKTGKYTIYVKDKYGKEKIHVIELNLNYIMVDVSYGPRENTPIRQINYNSKNDYSLIKIGAEFGSSLSTSTCYSLIGNVSNKPWGVIHEKILIPIYEEKERLARYYILVGNQRIPNYYLWCNNLNQYIPDFNIYVNCDGTSYTYYNYSFYEDAKRLAINNNKNYMYMFTVDLKGKYVVYDGIDVDRILSNPVRIERRVYNGFTS